tara:strand:- start:4353 stop:5522 length:1170 start_codon:yes stop_codon:yes gene_type:complete
MPFNYRNLKNVMKILHTVPHIDEEASGPSYTVPRLCEAIAKLDHEVTLSCLRGELEISNVKLITHSSWPVLKGFGISHNHTFSLIQNAYKMDIIHNHMLWSMTSIATGWVVPGKGAKLVTSPRGTISEWALNHHKHRKNLFWPLQKRVLEKANLIHVTSNSEHEDVRRLGIKQPVLVVPNGVDIPDLKEHFFNRKDRTLLFISRIHPKKGIETLIEAWTYIEDLFNDWKLKIVGPGDEVYVSKLKNLIAKKGLHNVEFTGPLYGIDKQSAYQSADIFVLPTHSENFGMVVAEALANNCPTIVSQDAPWSGIQDNNCGWWIPNNVDSLRNTLKGAMSLSKKELRTMGSNGRWWMKRDFSWDRIAILMEEGYNWLLNGGELPDTIKIVKKK